MKSILIVAAHPDDEVLGCGGAIARHALQGDSVHILILAQGLMSRSTASTGGDSIPRLRDQARNAAATLGAATVEFLEYPDNQMDSVPLLEVVKSIKNKIDCTKPELIYTHHAGDLNIDHEIAHRAVVTAARPLPGSTETTLLFFETLSSTEWQTSNSQAFFPNWFINISSTLHLKVQAMKCYSSEIREWPHPRSEQGIISLAHIRGCSSGVPAAEAFVCGRHRIL